MVEQVGLESENMKLDIRRLAQTINLAATGMLIAAGLFLVTSPFHQSVGDSHRGLMAIFPGVLLLICALLIQAIGTWSSRRGYAGSLIAILASVTVIVMVIALQSEQLVLG
jgi:F0F1-type ATP synthase assembly protein I